MAIEVDPGQLQRIEVDPSQLTPVQDQPDDNSFLGHAWDSFAGMFTGTAHAIAHPLDTAAGIKNEVQHHVNRASEEFHKGNISDGLAHAVAAVPLLGPMITQGGNELQQGHYRAAAGDILGTVEGANLFGKGTSKVVSAAKGIPAVADAIQAAVKDRIATGQPTVVEDILNHPEVQKAVKHAVSEAVNEIPGVRTARAMGGVASTAKRVMTDVTATRAARNLPASPKPQTVFPGGRSAYEPTFQGLPPDTGEAPAPMAGAQPMEPVQPQEGPPSQFSRAVEPEPIPASPQVATPSSASPMPQQAPAAGPVPMNTDVVPESGPRMAGTTPDWFEQNAPIKPRLEVSPSELQPIASSEPAQPEPQAQPVPEIPRIPVSQFNAGKSSNIEAIGYHPESQTMHVEFKNPKGENRVYEFTGVTPEEHSAFIKAESLGSHFARQIRPKYPTPGEMPKFEAKAAATAEPAPQPAREPYPNMAHKDEPIALAQPLIKSLSAEKLLADDAAARIVEMMTRRNTMSEPEIREIVQAAGNGSPATAKQIADVFQSRMSGNGKALSQQLTDYRLDHMADDFKPGGKYSKKPAPAAAPAISELEQQLQQSLDLAKRKPAAKAAKPKSSAKKLGDQFLR